MEVCDWHLQCNMYMFNQYWKEECFSFIFVNQLHYNWMHKYLQNKPLSMHVYIRIYHIHHYIYKHVLHTWKNKSSWLILIQIYFHYHFIKLIKCQGHDYNGAISARLYFHHLPLACTCIGRIFKQPCHKLTDNLCLYIHELPFWSIMHDNNIHRYEIGVGHTRKSNITSDYWLYRHLHVGEMTDRCILIMIKT